MYWLLPWAKSTLGTEAPDQHFLDIWLLLHSFRIHENIHRTITMNSLSLIRPTESRCVSETRTPAENCPVTQFAWTSLQFLPFVSSLRSSFIYIRGIAAKFPSSSEWLTSWLKSETSISCGSYLFNSLFAGLYVTIYFLNSVKVDSLMFLCFAYELSCKRSGTLSLARNILGRGHLVAKAAN